ncbi:MAG: OsmC family protein [Chitinophagaceae bacterium]|nr:OsmC family protein [Chitinophagaceae bacterium]
MRKKYSMADLHNITKKTGKRFLFEVKLNWLEDNLGLLEAKDVNGQLHTATSEKLGGKGNEWSAEHLLLSAVASSFMSTYLAYIKKMAFEISHFECSVIGQVKPVNGKYRFARIDVYPVVFVMDQLLKQKAVAALIKTEQQSPVTNSLKTDVFFHSQVITDEQNILRPALVNVPGLDTFPS